MKIDVFSLILSIGMLSGTGFHYLVWGIVYPWWFYAIWIVVVLGNAAALAAKALK